MRQPQLTTITLPEFGLPSTEPALGRSLYQARIERLRSRFVAQGLDAVVIYGDREHVANISWASGYDPRFEEALLVVTKDRKPTLFAGNEGFPYAEVAEGDFERVLWQQLSLMGQPRDQERPLATLLQQAGLKPGMSIGLAGWKGYENEAGTYDANWFETPHYLVNTLKQFGPVRNVADLLMNPIDGLRIINEVDQLARFEYAACHSSQRVKNVVLGSKPGMNEYEACSKMGFDGFPMAVHINMCAGPRAKYGLPSPSMRVMQQGEPIVLGVGLMGALNCRAGFLARGPEDLKPGIQDYVAKLVAPYFASAVAWYETIGIGVSGGEVYDRVMALVGDKFFGIGLNPGHYIHLDEWVHSPMKKGGSTKLRSGMALQCDIIPATGTDYFMSNIEDGIALADANLRAAFASAYPEAWARIEARRAFMMNTLGIRLKPEVLPFSNMAAWLPPFWLAPDQAMAMRDADA
ncbi:aminopeptidase P family N-terminal domain-containing protein [Aestuariivirga litoralis]|uniref:aminopeptidase P family N-terminal domain-containing protein n=1 Tax=Aestuariivirga litoralis TaxID=2650924 RepID=UPI0018C48070|nr:aminopeptidase P family N-terminal domain-containing protein [Aestuariivirga litoralis]MBG1233292.1 hypothetical protein [Aestuariivirga litoralis]